MVVAIKRLKEPLRWLKVATILEKLPTPTHNELLRWFPYLSGHLICISVLRIWKTDFMCNGVDISINFDFPYFQNFAFFNTDYMRLRRKLYQNDWKSTCLTDSFTRPRPSGNGIFQAMYVFQQSGCRSPGSCLITNMPDFRNLLFF